MKKIVLLLSVTFLALSSCKKEDPIEPAANDPFANTTPGERTVSFAVGSFSSNTNGTMQITPEGATTPVFTTQTNEVCMGTPEYFSFAIGEVYTVKYSVTGIGWVYEGDIRFDAISVGTPPVEITGNIIPGSDNTLELYSCTNVGDQIRVLD